jgi:hypothetical protein
MNNELILIHEGLPYWFPRLVAYILKCLENRDRFNYYNARKALGDTPDETIYVSNIRDVLKPFKGKWLRLKGRHEHIAMPSNELLHFWSFFYLPAQKISKSSIAFSVKALSLKRHRDLLRDEVFSRYLPVGYKSLKKDRLVTLILRKIFNSTSSYNDYVDNRLKGMSEKAKKNLNALSLKPISYSSMLENEYSTEKMLIELFGLILAKPLYVEDNNNLYLHLTQYCGDSEAFLLPDKTPVKPLPVQQCLGQVRDFLVKSTSHDNLLIQYFPKAQLWLMEKQIGDTSGLFDLLAWWRKALGNIPILKKELPDNYSMACRKKESPSVFAMVKDETEKLIGVALDFKLLFQDEKGYISLTELGNWLGGDDFPHLGVKVTWARNIEKITLELTSDWPLEFDDLLQEIAMKENGKFIIQKENILKDKIQMHKLLNILGSFTILDRRKQVRLRNWYSDTTLPKIIQAAAVSIEEIKSNKVEIEPGVKVVTSGDYCIFLGLSPTQLKSYFQQQGVK